MYNNSYMGYGQYPQYNPNYMQGYQGFQQQQQRPMQQPFQQAPAQQPMQNQEVPFSEVRYGTLDEAKAYIVMPGRAVMFINRSVGEFYIKSANNMGEPTLETFKYVSADKDFSADVKKEEPKVSYVKKEDLKDYATLDDLNRFEGTLTEINKKVDKALRLKDLIGGKEDGKQ